MKGRLIDMALSRERKWRVTIELDEDFRDQFDALHGSDVRVEIKKWRERRSKDANSYMWVLLDKLSAVLGRDKNDLYIDYVRRFGTFKDFTLTEDQAKTFSVAWASLGTGWPTEQVDFAPDGDHVVIRAYYGSSTYTTKRMSRLIDALVQDCKEAGIETMTPEELASMMRDYPQ